MRYFTINVSTVMSPVMHGATAAEIRAWLFLLGYCSIHENDGRITGAKHWTPRQWSHLLSVPSAVIHAGSELWSFEEDDLVVHYYPKDSQDLYHSRSIGGTNSGISRRAKSEVAKAVAAASNSVPNSVRSTESNSVPNYKIDRGEEIKGEEIKGEEIKGEEIKGDQRREERGDECTLEAHSGEARNSLPTSEEVLQAAADFRGNLQQGIPGPIPPNWALAWLVKLEKYPPRGSLSRWKSWLAWDWGRAYADELNRRLPSRVPAPAAASAEKPQWKQFAESKDREEEIKKLRAEYLRLGGLDAQAGHNGEAAQREAKEIRAQIKRLGADV